MLKFHVRNIPCQAQRVCFYINQCRCTQMVESSERNTVINNEVDYKYTSKLEGKGVK